MSLTELFYPLNARRPTFPRDYELHPDGRGCFVVSARFNGARGLATVGYVDLRMPSGANAVSVGWRPLSRRQHFDTAVFNIKAVMAMERPMNALYEWLDPLVLPELAAMNAERLLGRAFPDSAQG